MTNTPKVRSTNPDPNYDSREARKFVCRWPNLDLPEAIRLAGGENKRSMNSEIMARLEASFKPQQGVVITKGMYFIGKDGVACVEEVYIQDGVVKIGYLKGNTSPIRSSDSLKDFLASYKPITT